MKTKNFVAGDLDSIPNGVLLNQSQVAILLGISRPTAAAFLAKSGIKAIRLMPSQNAPLYVKAGELKNFLENGGCNFQKSEPPPANVPPADDGLAALEQFAMAAYEQSIFNEKNEPPADEPPALENSTDAGGEPPADNVELPADNVPTDKPRAARAKKKSKYLPPSERPKRVEIDWNAALKERQKQKAIRGYGSQ